jgi:hypothetical protein
MVPTSGDTNGKSPRRATVRAAAVAERHFFDEERGGRRWEKGFKRSGAWRP